jgi:hypothetical protein
VQVVSSCVHPDGIVIVRDDAELMLAPPTRRQSATVVVTAVKVSGDEFE